MSNLKGVLPKYIFNWKGVLAMVAGMLVFTLVLGAVDVFAMLVFKKNLQYDDFYMLLMNTAGLVGAILAFDFLICRPQTGKPLNFNFSTANFYTYILIFPMMLGMMLIAEFFTSRIPVTGPFFGPLYEVFSKLMEKVSDDVPMMIIMTVVFAPILEEIIFRGIIQKGLMNKGWEPWKAILTASVVFGIVHGNPWQFVGAILLGGVLGTVYYKTKSLLLSMFLHAFNNLISCLLIIFSKTESISDTVSLSSWALLGIGIVVFGVFYWLFMKKYRVHYSEN